MKLKERMKHYNFWVALTMAVIILLNTLKDAFGFNLDDKIVNDIIMAILGIMVVLGFVQKDNYDFVDTSLDKEKNEEHLVEIIDNKDNENNHNEQ